MSEKCFLAEMEEGDETRVMLLFIPQTTGNFNQLTDYCCSFKAASALCCRVGRQRDYEGHTEPDTGLFSCTLSHPPQIYKILFDELLINYKTQNYPAY